VASIAIASAIAAVGKDEVADQLSALEARVAKENSWPDYVPEFHRDVVALVEANVLATGDEFFRASLMAAPPIADFRAARMRYELSLAAVARGEKRAETNLAGWWDLLLEQLGRPLRFDDFGMRKNLDLEPHAYDPLPESIAVVWKDPGAARTKAAGVSNNAEVQEIVDADQADRKSFATMTPERSAAMDKSDYARISRIKQIVAGRGLRTAQDFANASLVLQHSAAFSGYQLAHELAVSSMLLGDRKLGRWLVAATYDRMLISIGHDQRFGTQGLVLAGKTILRDVDERGICDEERRALGCPTLSAKRANFHARAE
jgi:hypothetical protein